MYHPMTTLFGRTWSTYTVLLMIGILLSIAWMLLRARPGTRRDTLDACLLALVGGVLLGRAGHVLLHWAYFRDHTEEITQLYFQGGLSVHGVLLGAGLGLLIGARWRELDVRHLLDSAAFSVPLLGLAAWWGCAANACAYGAPVQQMTEYPPLLTWIEPDIYGIVEPRFAAQRIGMALSASLLILTGMAFWRDWFVGKRLPLAILALSLGNFMVEFMRVDYISLRDPLSPEAALYLVVMLLSAAFLVRNARSQTES